MKRCVTFFRDLLSVFLSKEINCVSQERILEMIMRKILVLVIVILLAIGVTGGLFTVAFFGHIPLGEPRLRIEFYPPPPWQVRPGDSLEVSIGVSNDAWLLAWAKDVRLIVFMPEGFTSPRTGTNECELNFFTLHGGDGLGNVLTIKVSNDVKPGNYAITVKVTGENVPEQIHTPQVIVS